MKIDLNDQSLMFLAFDWENRNYPSDMDDIIKSYQTLWYLNWKIKEKKHEWQGEIQKKELGNSLLQQTNRLLDSLGGTLLKTKPKNTFKGTQRLEEIQNNFEKVLLTLGRDGYREHANHQKRNYFLGIFLVNQLKLNLLENSNSQCWYPVACLHDFCYILQEIERVIDNLGKEIDDSIPGMKFSMKVASRFGSGFLAEKQKSILASIARLEENTVTSKMNYYSLLEKLEDRDHGIISAMFVHDLLFREKSEFKNDELNLITRAIAFHSNGRIRSKVRVEKDPLACLLILCDEIQEWKRPRADNVKNVVQSIEMNSININFQRWKAEYEFLKAILKGRSFKIFTFPMQVGEKTYQVKVNLKFHRIKDQWSLDVQIKTEYSSELDKMDLNAFQEKMVGVLNTFADSLFKTDPNRQLNEEDLALDLVRNNRQISGDIRILGKMEKLPVTANPRLFDILFSWILLKYVRRKERNRRSVQLGLENDQPLEFYMSHLDNKSRPRKLNNLKRIDYTENKNYEKILISSRYEENQKIPLFPRD